MSALRKVGFFHFGSRVTGADPIESLRASLLEASRKDDLGECLVVTPEAFNVVGDYNNPKCRCPDGLIGESLREMSVKCGVAFVAGLIEDPSYRELGYSSTYVIDAGVHELLSRKMKPDTSGLYKPCASNYDKPLFHRGICIAALICVDGLMFNHNVPSDRQSALLQRINACNAVHKVLCIPAHADEYDTRAVACNWFLGASLDVVVANSSPWQPSVIQNGGKVDDESRCAGQGNAVRFAALA